MKTLEMTDNLRKKSRGCTYNIAQVGGGGGTGRNDLSTFLNRTLTRMFTSDHSFGISPVNEQILCLTEYKSANSFRTQG